MNRWVLVTGGALRLGRETCLAFARAGWNVACHYHRSAEAASSLSQELVALGVKCALVPGPLNNSDDAERLFRSTLQHVDCGLHGIVNNASLFEPDTAQDFSEHGLLAQLQTNLIAPLTLGRMLYRHCADAQPAASSVLVHVLDQKVFNLNPDYFSYTLSKLALERAVSLQAQALAPLVRVNAIAPGLLYPSGPQSRENYELASRANLLRCPIEAARVAQAAVFLADNPCITGASLCVDNGQHLVPVPRDIMFVVDELLRDQSNEGR